MIELIVTDVDGTLTDGAIYYGDNNIELKAFSVKDGAVLRPLRRLGIELILLTGRESEAVARRAKDLEATAIQNISNKVDELKKITDSRNIPFENVAYIGDDINDYAAMACCGFKACPVDAAQEIKAICDYISPQPGGQHAVRDICVQLLKKEGKWDDLLRFYY